VATLAEMRDGAKELADLTDTDFVTDARWNVWVNQGVKRLFGLVATAFAEHFFEEHDFTLTSTEDGARFDLGDLDSPFMFARGVDKDPGTANACPVRRFNFSERNSSTSKTRLLRWVPDRTYRVMGSVLMVQPWQQAAGNYRLYYVGRPALLVDDDDTIPDVLELWSEFVEIFAALKALGKEETDTGDLGAQLGLIRADIELQASTRDEGEPDTIALVENDDIPYPYRR
jgi:hypothetical protein